MDRVLTEMWGPPATEAVKPYDVNAAPRYHLYPGVRTSDQGFDQRWRKHPRPQPTTEAQFFQKTGWLPEVLAGQRVVDAGCGCGRYCRFALDQGAAEVTGLDISPSGLEAAAVNTPGAKLVECSLLDIPLLSESVDVAFSIGVLHHTADPAAAFREVARLVHPGGRLAVWVYSQPAEGLELLASKWLHQITRACPPEVLYQTCRDFAPRLRDAYGELGSPLSRVLRASALADDEQCISDTFDWHTPQFRSWHTASEVRGWFESAGFQVTWAGAFPVSMSGVKG